ncbi:MAG: IS110 family transposase [Pseudomonadota bacterium]
MLATAVQSLLAARKTVESEIADLDKRLGCLARQFEACRRVMTIPGVGPVTALAAISAIDDVDRFGRARTAGAYFGLTPRRHQSGEVDHHGGITKRGDAMVRALLYEVATVLLSRVKKFSSLKSWGLKLAKRIGVKRARVAVARKTGAIIAAILKDGTEFWWKVEQPKTV